MFMDVSDRDIINLSKINSIVKDPSNPEGDRLLLLGVSDEGNVPSPL